MNQITVTGNVTKDPELRYTANNKAICTFSIATSYGKDDTKQTTFHDIKVFNEMADNVARSVGKGCRVTVVGRLEKKAFDRKDGGKGIAIDIIADEVALSLRWKSAVVDQTEQTLAKVQQAFGQPAAFDDDAF
jgi:single-strand DNA-binding protein